MAQGVDRVSTAPTAPVPGWLDGIVRCAAFGITSLGLVGLPLALTGHFRRVPVAILTLLLFGAMWLAWRRWQVRFGPQPRPAGTGATVFAGLAVCLALGSFAINAARSSEHLLVDGDPAVYAVSGALLAHNGSLATATHRDELFAGDPTLVFTGAGYDDAKDAPLVRPQFFHLLPVLLAVATWTGGVRAVLWEGPLVGAFALLAFFAFAARAVRPPWALLAATTLAVLLPQLHFSRDTFSETPAQLLVFAGLALLWDVTGHRGRAIGGPVVAGLVLGGAAMARVDSFFALVPIAAALLLLRAGRTGLAVLAGMLLPALVALADGVFGSPVYLATIKVPLAEIAVALPLLAGAAYALRRPPGWLGPLGRRLARPAAVAVVVGAAYAWLVRPHVSITRDIPERSRGVVTSLQQREHLPVAFPRAYDELTMRWLSWYLGPLALSLAVLGLALMTSRLLRGRDLRLAPFVLLTFAVTAVYVWKPAILPVQYWATRRFLPVSLPGLLLIAVLLCQQLWTRQRLLAAALGASVLSFPLALLPGATLPRDYLGLVPAFRTMCGTLLPSDIVLLAGGPPATTGLPQAVAGYCHVAAASVGPGTTTANVARISVAAHAQGRRLVVLSSVPHPAVMPAGASFRPVFDVTVPTTALVISHRPDEVFPYHLQLFVSVL